MKIIIFAGPPTSGKTSVIKHLIKRLKGKKTAYFKIDVQFTEDDQIIKKMGVSTGRLYSGELCPDHCFTLVFNGIVKWGKEKKADILFIETAGLCFRCSPYIRNILGIAVLEATSGMNLPQKVGPMLSLSDVVVITKTDMISQAEKEVFIEGIKKNRNVKNIIEMDALRGINVDSLLNIIRKYDKKVGTYKLRGTAPIGVCTLCIGKKETGWENHFGVLRQLNSDTFYLGE
jgi:Ni2+-binding GTPase involved in maturation of urease and hydrogenase